MAVMRFAFDLMQMRADSAEEEEGEDGGKKGDEAPKKEDTGKGRLARWDS